MTASPPGGPSAAGAAVRRSVPVRFGPPPVSASIAIARASSSFASASVAGHIGLKLYHWSGAAASVASSESAMAWVARWRSAGALDATVMTGA